MDPTPTPRPSDGRSFGWRASTALFGIVLGGGGYAVIRWPHLLAWGVGGAVGAVGLFLVVSAVAARGR